jgi:predicted nucleic acid-binding protein
MAKSRRIVPDNSVMMPAFFREEVDHGGNPFDLTRRAKPIADAIRMNEVAAFAPDLLFHEFMKGTHDKVSSRGGRPEVDLETASKLVDSFQSLRITYVPASELAERAWDLMANHAISPHDSWYLACAIHTDAELWVSHEHRDGFPSNARKVHEQVHLLTEQRF